jgi:ribose/xylose/arabinose/galactoside ABC-type transport system permease subunit
MSEIDVGTPPPGSGLRLGPSGLARAVRNARPTDLASVSGALIVVLLLIVAAATARGLYTTREMQSVADQAAGLGIVALGQMLVILVAGIDMSVSAVILFGVAFVIKQGGGTSAVLEAAAIAVGIGLLNGLLIARRQAPPFITTFGTLILIGGVELVVTQGSAGGSVPPWMHSLGGKNVGVIPVPLLAWLGCAVVLSLVLNKTVAGRWIYAIGTNREAAAFTGIPVGWTKVACYVVCALLAFAGGLVLAGYSGYVDQTLGNDANLNSIAAVVIGGTAFAGGEGRVSGAITGVLVIVIADNLVILAGLPIYWQYIVTGGVLMLAIIIQTLSGGGAPLWSWLRTLGKK